MISLIRILEDDASKRWVYIFGLAIVVIITALIARLERKKLNKITQHDFEKNYSGTKPWKCDGLKKRKGDLEAFNNARVRVASLHLFTLMFCGLLVPSLLLFISVKYFDWMFPGQSGFFGISQSIQPNSEPSNAEILGFVVSEFFHSAADLLDAAGIAISSTNVPQKNLNAHGLLLIYHLLVAGFVSVLITTGWTLLKASRSARSKLTELDERIHDQCLMEGKLIGDK